MDWLPRLADQMHYTDTANELTQRILALIPNHPDILQLTSPFDLFRVEGFKCDDLQPSLAQADWALRTAQARAKQEQG